MHLTDIKTKVKNLKRTLALVALLPFASLAQDCNFNISYSCWFNAQSTIKSISWDPVSGNKLAVRQDGTNAGGRFCNNANTDLVLNMGPGAVAVNNTLSKNYNYNYGPIVYGQTGGVFMNNYYIKPSGTQISVTNGLSGLSSYNRSDISKSIDRDTVVYVVADGGNARLVYANISDPENPVFYQIPTIYGISNNTTSLPVGQEAIATAGNRIYIATNNIDDANNPVIIKCRDFSGNACPNWSDVTISTGKVYDMKIRPTDGKIFVRGNLKGFGSSGWQAAQPGLVIFDSTGTLATGFNFSDLSLITGYPNYSNGGASYLVRFDADGNIFANMPLLTGSTAHGIGIYKFDPKGNLDMEFMRNVTNSYIFPGVTRVSSFDVNPITGALAVAVTDGGYLGKFHALQGGERKQGNNEMWDNAFQSIYVGDGASTNGQRGTSGYEAMHILYNNGKLKVQGESASTQTANCGTSTPTVVPYKDPAVGTIQCSGLSFMAAPVAGTPSTLVVKVPVNVTVAGIFKPITVSGSGMSMQDPYATFNAATVGINDFYLTLKYDGSALGTFSISVGGAGSCSANLTDQTKNNPSIINIWTPENCTYKVTGPDLK